LLGANEGARQAWPNTDGDRLPLNRGADP